MKPHSLLICLILFQLMLVDHIFAQNTATRWVSLNEDLKEPINSIVSGCLKAQTTKSDINLINESKLLIEMSRQQNSNWDAKYFMMVSDLQDKNARLQRYSTLVNRVVQLKPIIDQLSTNLISVREIYKNKLKAMPSGYLLLSQKKGDLHNQSRKDIDTQLEMIAKFFLKNVKATTFITSATEVKDFQVIKDVIKATEVARVESFENDPVRQMTPSNQFYLLQKYRVYPELEKPRHDGSDELTDFRVPQDYKGLIIDSAEKEKIPSGFLVGDNYARLTKMLEDINEFNVRQAKLLAKINEEYNHVIANIIAKRNIAEKEIKEVKNSLRTNFQDESMQSLNAAITDAEKALNRHVQSREMIVITNQSELSQSGQKLNELYVRMINQAYADLINRGKQLKSYKFFVVKNGVLVSQEASTYYSDPIPTHFSIPLRRETFAQEYGGAVRCGILLAMKIKFESREKVNRITSENGSLKKVLPIKDKRDADVKPISFELMK